MKNILAALLLAFSIIAPAFADNPARSPPLEFYSEKPIKGERIIAHKSWAGFLATVDPYGYFAARGETVLERFIPPNQIHVVAVGVAGIEQGEYICNVIHGRAHYIAFIRKKQWNHEGERFCRFGR